MFLKNYHLLFMVLLWAGTLIAVSANSWFTSWLGLEINLMSMIPLIIIKLNSSMTEAAIKYFLSQALASLILIFSTMLNFQFFETTTIEVLEVFLLAAITLKAGIAPLHFWFPQVIKMLTWWQALIMFTWQKVAPLILMTSFNIKVITVICMLSAAVGALGGFNQTTLKIIMTYSSISHSGWMVLACVSSFFSWMNYFMIYSILSFSVILFFSANKTEKMNHIFMNQDSSLNKMTLIMNMLSLGGLPPLLGFAAKISVILTALNSGINYMFIVLILSSVVSLFFYSRVIYSNLMNQNLNMNLLNSNYFKYSATAITSSTFLNLILPASMFML